MTLLLAMTTWYQTSYNQAIEAGAGAPAVAPASPAGARKKSGKKKGGKEKVLEPGKLHKAKDSAVSSCQGLRP